MEYSISVPFERYSTTIKCHIEERRRLCKLRMGVIQLYLFKPHDFNYRYKVIVSNKTTQARQVVEYHKGRGSQEGLFAELKTEAAMSYAPFNGWNANKLYLLSHVIAHNLTRELPIVTAALPRNRWKYNSAESGAMKVQQNRYTTQTDHPTRR